MTMDDMSTITINAIVTNIKSESYLAGITDPILEVFHVALGQETLEVIQEGV